MPGLTVTWLGHGQMAVEAKPVPLDPGSLWGSRSHGPGVSRVPRPAPLASPPVPLGYGLAKPRTGHGQVMARSVMAIFMNYSTINYELIGYESIINQLLIT